MLPEDALTVLAGTAPSNMRRNAVGYLLWRGWSWNEANDLCRLGSRDRFEVVL
jgi:hypothetical protein